MLSLALTDDAELRPLEPWQAEEFATHVESIREHLLPWIPFAHRVVDVETARTLLQRFADLQARDEGRFYGIWVGGKLSGGTLFRTFDAVQGGCEIGVWLSPSVEGRGLISRAVHLMIDWAINVRGVYRVEWMCDPRNERSRAVARRAGMTCEGVRRKDFILGGERRDSEVWAVLADEWPPRA